jgi:hypothetical protein
MPLLFTTPSGEAFELTLEELNVRLVYLITTSHMADETCPKPSVPGLELPMLAQHAGASTFDSNGEASITPPLQTSTAQSPHSLSCASSSPLIEILTPDELLRKTSPDPSHTPTSPSRPGRRDGSKACSFVKVSMAYNEYGELMEECKLQHHPTPDKLSVTQLLRVIRKKFHHNVNARTKVHSTAHHAFIYSSCVFRTLANEVT